MLIIVKNKEKKKQVSNEQSLICFGLTKKKKGKREKNYSKRVKKKKKLYKDLDDFWEFLERNPTRILHLNDQILHKQYLKKRKVIL